MATHLLDDMQRHEREHEGPHTTRVRVVQLALGEQVLHNQY
jgi:hypothetical protein